MPSIYITEKEFEALNFLVGVARNVSDGAMDETYLKDFQQASEHFSDVEKKYFKANRKKSSKQG
ncbi:hypothetical protein D6U73_17335 [Vibrio cholerae]|nr:hypothetical protein [Vibrio cholerae]MVE45238.1 hypothetical protein [Vibrio cholerae]